MLGAWILGLWLATVPPTVQPFYDNEGQIICTCQPETVDVTPLLDVAWKNLQDLESRHTKRPRPKFCFIPEPLFMFVDGRPGFLYGYTNLKRNEVLMALVPDPQDARCIALHEMMHALFGSGHKDWPKKMAAVGCQEE